MICTDQQPIMNYFKMEYPFIHIKKYTVILATLLLLLGAKAQAQCNWGINAVAQTSTCAANGKITLTLTGEISGLSKLLYSLEPLVEGGYAVSQNTSLVFENVPAGSYRAIAQAVCNGFAVTAVKEIVVPGTYVPFKAAAVSFRAALLNCNTGQASIIMEKGKLPYNITITNAPAEYAGRTFFTTSSLNFIIDSLNKGSYTIKITDDCGATSSVQTVDISELSPPTASDFYLYSYRHLPNSCNTIIVPAPTLYSNTRYQQYTNSNTPLMFSVSYDGGPKLPYKKLYNNQDTLVLPDGKTFKDAYGKKMTFYFKTPCGTEWPLDMGMVPPTMAPSYTARCGNDFDFNFYFYNNNTFCYPIYTSIKNTSTNVTRYDTIPNAASSSTRAIKGLPYGTYNFISTTGDGHVIYQTNGWVVSDPNTINPYYVSAYNNSGVFGNDGAVQFSINKVSGNYNSGTVLEMITPGNRILPFTIGENYNSSQYTFYMTNILPYKYLTPGNYLFRVKDACGTYDLPVTIQEKDVYRYSWSIEQEQTCTGLKLTPSGVSRYNNTNQPVYFKIRDGPQGGQGFDPSIKPAGSSLLLPLPGNYKIGIGSYYTSIGNYGTYGTEVNIKTVTYDLTPLAIDINNSVGWVCPGLADNAGNISVKAINGGRPTGVVTYKLAAAGQGITGPFLATNTTGKFSTATSGGAYTLIKNSNYDVRVEDECGAAAVQTLKVLDFATAQIASADKPQYCLNDVIRFKIINLPTTAVTYQWSGPDNFTSNLQNPIVSQVTANSGGTYHVVINSDICAQAILSDVDIVLAPYVVSCYSAVTDTSVNPYAYGLLGNWRPSRSYTYYGPRAESDPAKATNIRKDGTFDDFVGFWKKQTRGWKATPDTSRWVWNAATTSFNKKGFELENKDPLGRYNTAIYGYDNAIPVAVVQNSRYRESAYEGFEDYGFGSNSCDMACAVDRRFDFSAYKTKIDSSQKHTGRYSIRVQPGDTVGIKSLVTTIDSAFTSPVFKMGSNSCSPYPVLKSVRVTKGVLLPSFSPSAGKKVVVSAWVKEAQDCKCTSYSSNRLEIAVAGSTNTTVIAQPSGGIIEGWQRYEQVVDVPAGTTSLSLVMTATGTATVYFDDIRVHPYSANMKSFVYDPVTLRLMAELDENNFATFYEYDDDGTLTRLKKETERGIKTIRETRSALIKE
jgi:hypothetical protein